MPHYSCAHGSCKNDYRSGLKFVTFPKLSIDADRVRRWLQLLGRNDLNFENITPQKLENMFLCELHFPEDADLNYR